MIDHWLAHEPLADGIDPTALDDAAALDSLLRAKPGAAAFLWREAPIDWYRVRPTPGQLGRLRVGEGPPDMLWRALSPDGTVDGAARRVTAGDPDRLTERTGVDVRRVLRLAAEIERRTETEMATKIEGGNGVRNGLPALVCFARRPWARPFVADGNHRAVAAAVALRGGASVRPPGAYLGVGRNRPLAEAKTALRSLLWSVRARLAGRDEPNGF